MVKVDPYNVREKYQRWRHNADKFGITGITAANSQIILQYLQDMERGVNVATSNKKGARSFVRLNVASIRITYLAKEFDRLYSLNKITNVSEDQLRARLKINCLFR